MIPHAGHPDAGEPASPPPTRDALADYRRLLGALVSRAKWLGSRDPESAAQETLKRSMEKADARPAVEFYFSQDLPAGCDPPEWPLDQLLAWLHGVLYYVVREEHSRASSRREISDGDRYVDPADPAPDQLDALIRRELRGIVADSFPKLGREYQKVLRMRVDGMKYGEIADRLGVSENTVATWVSRGIRELAQHVRRRTVRLIGFPGGPGR